MEPFGALLDAVRWFVFNQGGDGEGYIISPRYQELADWFGDYEKKFGKYFNTRYDGDGVVEFSDRQETITFIESRDKLPSWKPDIVVEIN